MKIPLSAPDITESEIDAVTEVLRGSQLSLGPRLEEFEEALASYIGVPHAVAVSSGTAGLHLAMLALGLGVGDEVLLPSFTFIAAANAIRYVGATPVFVDIDEASLNLDVNAVERAITPRTRAIMVVHTFGRPASIARLMQVARAHGLFVIEDACEALGAEAEGKRVGSFGDIGVFAFYPNKQITTGEGGMIVTSNAAFAAKMRSLRNQGREASDDWFQHAELGYNYRLSEIACALGVAQMQRLPQILTRRQQVAAAYDAALRMNCLLELPDLEILGERVSWFVYVIRLNASLLVEDRDIVVQTLRDAGIACGRYFAPIHRQPAYAAWHATHLPVTNAVASRTIALPFFNRLTDVEIQYVAATLRTATAPMEAASAACVGARECEK